MSTWQNRRDQVLTMAAYRQSGGVAGALPVTADATLERVDLASRDIARRVLTRLVRLGDDIADARRKVSRAELVPNEDPAENSAVMEVLDRFVNARLITVDTDAVEITHEALIRAWPQLHDWIEAHACGMLAVALDMSAVGAGEARSVRSYAVALADIEEHLADEDLSPATTARRLGVSVRRLHGLFAGHERSYTATVRRLRLERAWRDLRDPARSHLRVIDIAVEAGFVDVTSFHRAFCREFGHTPGQTRPTSP